MEAVAKTRYFRVSPTKARLVVDMIRGKGVESALQILTFARKRVADVIKDTLQAAIANAENNMGMDVDTLIVSKVHVDQGPVMKRMSPRARGRSGRIIKRTSHIVVAVGPKS